MGKDFPDLLEDLGSGRTSRTFKRIWKLLGGAGDLVSKVRSRVIIGVTPFRVLITLLITYLLSPLPLQVEPPIENACREG